jgi:acyl phosphate:glycerol-3-phosphate acyltransferase
VGSIRSASVVAPVFGRSEAALALGDGLKGLVGGGIGWLIGGEAGAYAGVAGAMLGHAFPAFSGFHGESPVVVFAGGAFVLSPLAAAIALVASGLVTAIASSLAWGVRAGFVAFPLVQLFFAPAGRVAATVALMLIIAVRVAADRRVRAPVRAAHRPDS